MLRQLAVKYNLWLISSHSRKSQNNIFMSKYRGWKKRCKGRILLSSKWMRSLLLRWRSIIVYSRGWRRRIGSWRNIRILIPSIFFRSWKSKFKLLGNRGKRISSSSVTSRGSFRALASIITPMHELAEDWNILKVISLLDFQDRKVAIISILQDNPTTWTEDNREETECPANTTLPTTHPASLLTIELLPTMTKDTILRRRTDQEWLVETRSVKKAESVIKTSTRVVSVSR